MRGAGFDGGWPTRLLATAAVATCVWLGWLHDAAPAQASELPVVRLGVLEFGTVNWELDVIRHHELDRENGFVLEVQGYGGDQAARIALQGGEVDMVVADYFWVSRQRSEGGDATWIPYSSSVGAVMVPTDGGIDSLADLEGKAIGIAGNPTDKGWLVVQALARHEHGLDLAKDANPVFGAAPLMTEKMRQGELGAVLNYWHFAARLEGEGYRRLIDYNEAARQLGVPLDVPQLGYVFSEAWAAEHSEVVQGFAEASKAAKAILAESDAEWERIRPRTGADDDAVFAALRQRFRDGIVTEWGPEELDAAVQLYAMLAELGGAELVGRATELVPGTFWEPLVY
jgi:NitT/TauT family transport system substrate-binding protein